jgi:hypothetical protein
MSNKNNFRNYGFVIAAAVAATAGIASAQGVTMKATIPFTFSINRNANLAPGNYIVTRDRNVWLFRNEDTYQAVLIPSPVGLQGKADEKPSLTFECAGERCQLRAIRMGGGAVGAALPAPKLNKADAEELALVNVPLEPFRGE